MKKLGKVKAIYLVFNIIVCLVCIIFISNIPTLLVKTLKNLNYNQEFIENMVNNWILFLLIYLNIINFSIASLLDFYCLLKKSISEKCNKLVFILKITTRLLLGLLLLYISHNMYTELLNKSDYFFSK